MQLPYCPKLMFNESNSLLIVFIVRNDRITYPKPGVIMDALLHIMFLKSFEIPEYGIV